MTEAVRNARRGGNGEKPGENGYRIIQYPSYHGAVAYMRHKCEQLYNEELQRNEVLLPNNLIPILNLDVTHHRRKHCDEAEL